MEDRELTMDEVAERLRTSRYTVWRRIKRGKIRARKEGTEWRIKESDLRDYIESTQYTPTETDE